MLGKDFLKVFETSPVPTSISVNLDPRYVLEDSLKVVEAAIGKSPLVDEVVYQRSLRGCPQCQYHENFIGSGSIHLSDAVYLLCAD